MTDHRVGLLTSAVAGLTADATEAGDVAGRLTALEARVTLLTSAVAELVADRCGLSDDGEDEAGDTGGQ